MKEEIFSPKSIAVVGASINPRRIGSVMMQNLVNDGYEGQIYPVNPKYQEILGRKSYPDVLSIEEPVDQACIAIPAEAVEKVVDQCIEKKVKSIVIISAGFKETGKEGENLEKRIAGKIRKAGIRLLGPNCLGYINNKEGVNLSFARKNPGNGSTAFISQSGAFCCAVLDMAKADGFGFSHIVSIGNKPDIEENELIEMFEKDPTVDAIALYIEQFSDGKEFVSLAQKSKKPIVAIVPGSSEKAQMAISSHTGSLANPHDTIISALRKSNAVIVDSAVELYNMIKVIKNGKLSQGENVTIITNAGGPGIIAADNIAEENLYLTELSKETIQNLKENLPPSCSIHNPVDLLGDASADRYEKAINAIMEDQGTDCILVVLTPQLITDIIGTAERIVKLQEKSSKPIFACFLGKEDVKSGVDMLREYGVFVSDSTKSTIELIKKLVKYSISKKKDMAKVSDIKASSIYIKDILEITKDQTEILPDTIVEKILKEHSIEIPKQLITSNIEDAKNFAINRFPVVIKATSKDLAHKTDFNAIYLDIRTMSEFEEKIMRLREAITNKTGITSPEVFIQEMVTGQAEIFIGAGREGNSKIYEDNGKGFGHLLSIGQGGIYTEVYKDIENVLLPASRESIDKALSETKIAKIIDGYRGKPKLAKEKLLDMLENIQRMLISYPQIVSLDINPVIMTEDRVVAVDVKMYIKN